MSFPAYPEYKETNVRWLGDIPSHWDVQPIKRFSSLKTGSTPPTEDFDNFAIKGYPWIRPDVLDESGKPVEADAFLTWKGTQYARSIREPSVLVCSIGSIGKIGYADRPVFTNQQITAIETDLPARYVFFAFLAARPELDLRAMGNVVRIISGERLGEIPVPMPPEREARRIWNFLDHETARIDALIEEQQRLIELLKEKRQAVISHAVTKGLDPNVPMKDSGVEWFGEIPEHWTIKRLKHVTPLLTVGIVVNPSLYIAEDGVPFIYGGEIEEGTLRIGKARKISRYDSYKHSKTMLQEGDLVTVRVGAPGVTAVVPAEAEEGNCASVMLIKKGGFDSSWLSSVMNSVVIRTQVDAAQYGAAQKQFNISDAVDFVVPVPPAEEQGKITEVLDDKCSRIAQLMGEVHKSIDILEERRSALISAAVTGKIDVRDWQPPEGEDELRTTAQERAEV